MLRSAWCSLPALALLGCIDVNKSSDPYYDSNTGGSYYGDYSGTPSGSAGFVGASGFPGFGGFPSIPFPSAGGSVGADPPTDSRPIVSASSPPPPVSGGTLLITHDGKRAVMADPDRDRVSIVGLPEKKVLGTVALQAGDEPGRVVEDDAGRVHVALRRGGAVVSIDIASAALLRRVAVCGAPRGIVFDPGTRNLQVACAGGDLVTVPADGGDPTRRLTLDAGLRDVIVVPDGLVVTQFKSAKLIKLDHDGKVTATLTPTGVDRVTDNVPSGMQHVEPALAWRAIASPTGEVRVLHQYDLAETIDVSSTPTTPVPQASPYGAPLGGCGGLVEPAVSTLGTDGKLSMGAPISAPILAVDASVSFDGQWVALAHAGTTDPAPGVAPTALTPDGLGALGQVSIVSTNDLAVPNGGVVSCTNPTATLNFAGQVTAVAFNPAVDAQAVAGGTWLAVQTREPASLVLVRDPLGSQMTTIALGGASVFDTGHEIFHRDSGAGIACASCHAEGTDDGRVWKFSTGDRRTQSVNIGLKGTEPFHWDGDVPDLSNLMELVFVHRMGGPHEDPTRVTALSSWLETLTPPARIVDTASAAAVRGKALFESKDVGCSSCHSGPKFTSNQNANVGTVETGHFLQVPSLIGVGFRAPYLHNGCAASLRDRFDPACGGGDKHGTTSTLSDAQIGDIISYLQSL